MLILRAKRELGNTLEPRVDASTFRHGTGCCAEETAKVKRRSENTDLRPIERKAIDNAGAWLSDEGLTSYSTLGQVRHNDHRTRDYEALLHLIGSKFNQKKWRDEA